MMKSVFNFKYGNHCLISDKDPLANLEIRISLPKLETGVHYLNINMGSLILDVCEHDGYWWILRDFDGFVCKI